MGGGASLAAGRYEVVSVLGESNFCNSNNNGLDVLAAGSGQAMRIVNADHCDFESDTDWLCELGCPDLGGSRAAQQDAIAGLITSAAVAAFGDAFAAETWWQSGGHHYEDLISTGVAQPE